MLIKHIILVARELVQQDQKQRQTALELLLIKSIHLILILDIKLKLIHILSKHKLITPYNNPVTNQHCESSWGKGSVYLVVGGLRAMRSS